jgi:hypothetical protein
MLRVADYRRHRIAVVRVEVREATADGFLIELLEVGPERKADLVVGRATDPVQAGVLLEGWLRKLAQGRSQTW